MVEQFEKPPLAPALQATLKRAHDYASGQAHGHVTLEHLMLALTEDEAAAAVLHASRLDLARLRNDLAAYLGSLEDRTPPGMPREPAISQALTQILSYATLAARQGRRPRVDGAIVLAALVGDGRSMAAGFLKAQGLTFEETIRVLQRVAAGNPAPAEVAGLAPAPQLASPPPAKAQAVAPAPVPPGGQPDVAPTSDFEVPRTQPVRAAPAAPRRPVSAAEDHLAAARERIGSRTAHLGRHEPEPAEPPPSARFEPSPVPARAPIEPPRDSAPRAAEPSAAEPVAPPVYAAEPAHEPPPASGGAPSRSAAEERAAQAQHPAPRPPPATFDELAALGQEVSGWEAEAAGQPEVTAAEAGSRGPAPSPRQQSVAPLPGLDTDTFAAPPAGLPSTQPQPQPPVQPRPAAPTWAPPPMPVPPPPAHGPRPQVAAPRVPPPRPMPPLVPPGPSPDRRGPPADVPAPWLDAPARPQLDAQGGAVGEPPQRPVPPFADLPQTDLSARSMPPDGAVHAPPSRGQASQPALTPPRAAPEPPAWSAMPPPSTGAVAPRSLQPSAMQQPHLQQPVPLQQPAPQQQPPLQQLVPPAEPPPRGPAIDASKVAHTIPARLKAGRPVTVEVRVGRAAMAGVGAAPVPASMRSDLIIARAISVRLKAARPVVAIEASSPETHWDQPSAATGRLSGETAVWRFAITPQVAGRLALHLQISARTVGADGVLVDTTLPDEIVQVRVAADVTRSLVKWGGIAGIAVLAMLTERVAEVVFGFDLVRLARRLVGM